MLGILLLLFFKFFYSHAFARESNAIPRRMRISPGKDKEILGLHQNGNYTLLFTLNKWTKFQFDQTQT